MVIRIGSSGSESERSGEEAASEAIRSTSAPQNPPPTEPQAFGTRRVSLRDRLGLGSQAPRSLAGAEPPKPAGSLRELLDADQARRNEQGQSVALSSFVLAVKSDPTVRAEAQAIAEQLGVDPDTAERNLGVMREYAKVRALRDRALSGVNPVLARHVADLEFARIAHDDVENLGAWERLFAQWDVGRLETERGNLGTLVRSGQASKAELDRLAFVNARLAAMPQASGLFEGAAKVLGQQFETLPRAAAVGTAYATAAGATAAIAGQAGPQVALPEEVITVPAAMTGGFGVGFVGELASQSFKIEGGNAYLDMIEQGYDRDVAGRSSIGVGVANSVLELVGVKLLARGAGITQDALRAALRTEVREGVQAALTKPTLGEAAKNFLKAYGTGLAGEVSTEVAQEAVNIAAEEITRQLSENPDALSSSVTRDEIVQRLVDVAAQTAQGMALLAAPGPGLQLVRDARRASAAEHTAQFWRELGTASDASQVRKRNVGRIERFLADAAAGTEASSTYVDGQAFADALRQADLEAHDRGDPTLSEKLERAIPGITERVADAAARGDDVVLPTSEVASKIAGTEAYAPLLPHLRLDPDAMSAAEAKRFRQDANERAAEAAEILQQSETEDQAFAASAREVEERLREQLVASRAKPFDNTYEATAAAKFYRDIVVLRAQQAGVLPSELYAKFPLTVVGEVGGAAPASKGALRSGGRGAYDPRTFTILLRKKADGSTFLHELAHHNLHMLGDLAAAPDAPQAFQDDMNQLLKWFGVKDIETWQSMTLEQQRKHHEAFAYSFETWLFEGKAPSRELEGLFRRFKRWLRKVYTSIRDELNPIYRKQFGEDLPVLTPEVRGVMERMVASEEQIEHQQQIDNMAGVFESQEAAGATDAEWAAYLQMRDESREAAIEQHTRDSLRQMRWLSNARGRILRDLQKREDAARDRVRGEVDAELRRQPVYRAQRWITHSELDGAPAIPVGGRHKLATEAVRSLLPEGTDLRKFGGRYGLVAKDGLLPDVVAGMFGFETGRELVEALVAARPLDRVVDERTDERMLEEHSDLVDPAQRQAAVDEALHNEARTRQIGVEMRMLTRAMQPVRLLTAAARQAAKRIIGRQKVGEVNPRRHSLAEARAARRVTEALRRGDTEAAIAAQRQRMLQHELYKEAARADDERGETVTTFQRFFDADEKVAKTRDIDLVYPGRALAAAFGFGRKLLEGQESQLVDAARTRLAETHPVLATNVSAWLSLQATRGTAYVDLAMEELRDLREQGENLWSEAAKARFIELEGRRAELTEVVGGFTLRIDNLPRRAAPGARAGDGGTPSGLGRVAMRFWNAVAHLKRAAHWARFMDGGNRGPFHTYLLDPIDAALARYRDARDRMVKRVRDRVVEVAKAAGPAWDAAISAPELGFKFNGKKELLGALLHAGSWSNLTKLLVGYGWAPPTRLTNDQLQTAAWDRFLERMFEKGILTQQDVEFVQFVWDTYKEQLPANQAAHKQLYGFEFATIEHREVKTPFGTLEGGYVPAYADRDLAQPRLDGRRLDALEGEEFAFIYSVSTGRGHTLQRNPFYQQPLSLDVARQVAHMDQQLRFTHLQPQIKQAMRIIRNRDFKASLDAYDREAVQTILVPWLEAVAAHSSTRPSTNPFLDMLATGIRRSVSLVYLGFNIGNSLIQLSGFNNARADVSGRWMRAGLWTLVRNPMAAVRDAMDRSSMMRDRFDTSAEAYREEIQRLGNMPFDVAVSLQRATRKQRQRLGRAAFFAQRVVQGMVDTMTWHGAHQQSLAESQVDGSVTLEQAEAAAVRDADLAVRRTQGSGNPEDAAAYEQNTPLMKLMLQFSQYPNLVLNQIMGAGHGVRPRLQAMLWTLLLPAIAESTMKMLLVGAPDDGDGDGVGDELAAHYARGLARNVVGLVPVAGPMALAMAETEGTRVMASPASSLLQSFFRAGFAGADAVGGDALSSSELREIGKMLTVLTGFPIVPVTRAAAYDMDVESGRAAEPSNSLDYLRGLVVGR